MSDRTVNYESVIGLEVHVQLATCSKLFCSCPNLYGADPNTNVCPVCTGQPGVLPVLNAEALRLAIRAGIALDCSIARRTKFDRKNYFYPDLPKGYQVSQFDQPINHDGGLDIAGDDGELRRIGIIRAHLEEDAGKTIHPDGESYSLVDLNRTGIPLLEIVSAPDLRSPLEAHRYLVVLKRILRYARVSDCDMEKGSLRCDANVSVRPRGSQQLTTRTEVKNLNSFRNVERALRFEIERQIDLIESGGKVVQETRMWREAEERTASLRSKEEAHDYRYFPEPDLPEFLIEEDVVEAIREELPEMPIEKLRRYMEELALPEQTAQVLSAEPENSDYFDRCIALGGSPAQDVANFVMSSVLQQANDQGLPVSEVGIPPEYLVEVVNMVQDGALSNQAARKVIPALADTGKSPAEVVRELGLRQVSDRDELGRIIETVIAATTKAVEEYRGGKKNALNSLIGGVMKATKGKANPNLVRELLLEKLGD